MKLLRLATIYLNPEPQGWTSWGMRIGGVSVETHPLGKETPSAAKRLLVTAEVSLPDFPALDEKRRVLVPEGQRRQCEEAIEAAASLISVMGRCRRRISSPHPWVAFLAENPGERHWLEETDGIAGTMQGIPGTYFGIEPREEVFDGLRDRFEGIVLLAESFSHDSQLGRYRELIRFFELAFSLPAGEVGKKLSQFLKGASMGYTRAEVESWLELRHGASHGDKRQTSHLVIEADVRPYAERLEQAALDVLLNKVTWHDPSRERRNLWKPIAYTTSATGDLTIAQGAKLTFLFQTMDAFGVYPFDLSAGIENPPDEWWCKMAESVPGGEGGKSGEGG